MAYVVLAVDPYRARAWTFSDPFETYPFQAVTWPTGGGGMEAMAVNMQGLPGLPGLPRLPRLRK